MQCVILAGGLGTRMWPAARRVPKTLLEVAGRPFADWQLEWLARAGVTDVVYCVGYLGEQVAEHIGDGSRFGLRVCYVEEGRGLRGTAGALRLASDQNVLDEEFLVLYGDSWLQVDPSVVFAHAHDAGLPALMTLFENDGRWDASNAVYGDGRVVRYEKGLQPTPAEMRWIDYGLSALRQDLVADRVASGTIADLAPLMTTLASERLLAGLVVPRRFYEIGSPQGRAELEDLLSGGRA